MIYSSAKLKNNIYKFLLRINGTNFNREYSKIEYLDNLNDFTNFQKMSVDNLLNHSCKNVKYYKEIFEGYFNKDMSFKEVPILTKNIIKENFKEIISNDLNKRSWYCNSTGGSTGEPLRFVQDKKYIKWAYANNYYYYKNILGIDEPKSKKIVLWGSEKDLFENKTSLKTNLVTLLNNTISLNSFKMTDEYMDKYINYINSYKPDLIRGYAGSLYEICRYAERKNKKIHTPQFVISAAETLRSEMRKKIEEIFGTKVYNFYGSREISSIAGECKEGCMHILPGNYIEILKGNAEVKVGKEGKIVITNLFNYAMPFIRYEIGDLAIKGPKKCKCGSVLPTMKKVTGRITDHFLLENGNVIPAEFFIHLIGVVCNLDAINKFQVIQEDYNELRILVVLNSDMKLAEKKNIENKIKVVMGEKCRITWETVNEIPKTKTGKFIYTKSLVWNDI